jgi:ribosomal protein S21
MANAVRVRVELKNYKDDRELDFKIMFSKFKKACSECKVMRTYKQHESYESKSRKRRRKTREAEIDLLKNKLRENLIQQNQGKKLPLL